MAFHRRDLKQSLAHPPLPQQLGLFAQSGLTEGQVEATSEAVRAALRARRTDLPGTRFPARPGCALCCDCDRCLA